MCLNTPAVSVPSCIQYTKEPLLAGTVVTVYCIQEGTVISVQTQCSEALCLNTPDLSKVSKSDFGDIP